MDLKKILRFEVFISFMVIVFVIVCYFKFKEDNNFNLENEKILHYYGGHHCPHSNKTSKMYKLIHYDFKEKYNNTNIVDYWGTEEKDRENFLKNNIQYVPTLLNNNGNVLKIGIPDNIDTTDKNEDELETLLFNSIYDQL